MIDRNNVPILACQLGPMVAPARQQHFGIGRAGIIAVKPRRDHQPQGQERLGSILLQRLDIDPREQIGKPRGRLEVEQPAGMRRAH